MGLRVLDKEELIEAIYKYHGKVGIVADVFGVTLQTVLNYRKRYADVARAIENARAHFDTGLCDVAETKLKKAVEGEKAWAIKYALSTKGKSRGYVERQEITGAEGREFGIVVLPAKTDK